MRMCVCVYVCVYTHKVNNQIYPLWTYAYFAFLLPVGMLSEGIGYKATVMIGMIARETTRAILIFESSLTAMQLTQISFGFASASEIVYFTFVYVSLPKEHYHRAVTVCVCVCVYEVCVYVLCVYEVYVYVCVCMKYVCIYICVCVCVWSMCVCFKYEKNSIGCVCNILLCVCMPYIDWICSWCGSSWASSGGCCRCVCVCVCVCMCVCVFTCIQPLPHTRI